jgi:hypothetical protein
MHRAGKYREKKKLATPKVEITSQWYNIVGWFKRLFQVLWIGHSIAVWISLQ